MSPPIICEVLPATLNTGKRFHVEMGPHVAGISAAILNAVTPHVAVLPAGAAVTFKSTRCAAVDGIMTRPHWCTVPMVYLAEAVCPPGRKRRYSRNRRSHQRQSLNHRQAPTAAAAVPAGPERKQEWELWADAAQEHRRHETTAADPATVAGVRQNLPTRPPLKLVRLLSDTAPARQVRPTATAKRSTTPSMVTSAVTSAAPATPRTLPEASGHDKGVWVLRRFRGCYIIE